MTRVYALSPADEDGFLTAIQVRHKLRPVSDVEAVAVRSSLWNRTVGADPMGTLLFGGGLVGVLILFGDVDAWLPGFAGRSGVSLQCTRPTGRRARESRRLFLLPFIGLLAWLVRRRMGSLDGDTGPASRAPICCGAGRSLCRSFSFLALYSLMN